MTQAGLYYTDREPEIFEIFEIDGYAGIASTERISVSATTTPYSSFVYSGDSGQLFSIEDNLIEGSIFSVNDVSGISLINVDAASTITFKDNVNIGVANSEDPINNSELKFYILNNTELTVSVRGTDGTIRTGIITLS